MQLFEQGRRLSSLQVAVEVFDGEAIKAYHSFESPAEVSDVQQVTEQVRRDTQSTRGGPLTAGVYLMQQRVLE
jgi:hypothetical protein